MIEAIIDYIQKRGFIVHVYVKRLAISKIWNGEIFMISWRLLDSELLSSNGSALSYLIQIADAYMMEIDGSIKERRACEKV